MTVQPGLVCNVIWFVSALFTPSMMSISPPAGQVPGPSIQYAGHAPQPTGMCDMSAMKRPLFHDLMDVRR